MQNQQPQATHGELVERAGAGVPDLRTLSFEQFVEIFVERLKNRPDILELSSKSLAAAARATALAKAITSSADYAAAFEVLGTIAALVEDAEGKRLEITRPIDAAKKLVMGVFAPDVTLMAEANTLLRRAAATWKEGQDRREREERERQEAIARAERQRLANEAEARRRAADAEAQKKREEARRLEEEGKHREAARIASAADSIVEKADAAAVNLERRAESVVAEPVRQAAPTPKGVANREVWTFEIVDKSKISAPFMCPDETKIASTVRLHKEDAVAIVGEGSIRVRKDTDFSVKKRR